MAIAIKARSGFRQPVDDVAQYDQWIKRVQAATGRLYERKEVTTSLGKTQVWCVNRHSTSAKTLVVFPGARTSALFWDVDGQLDVFGDARIFLVETNGLPNASDGATPDIHGDGWGVWAAEVVSQLGLTQTDVAGASFGGLVAMKLALSAPATIKQCFLLNPGCVQRFSLSPRNLYLNLLPIVRPTAAHIRRFLDGAIFCKPHHACSVEGEQLIVDYELLALTRYLDQTQKPYDMGKALQGVRCAVHVLLGDHDSLFPSQRSARAAKRRFSNLASLEVFENVGHGIELYRPALAYVAARLSVDGDERGGARTLDVRK